MLGIVKRDLTLMFSSTMQKVYMLFLIPFFALFIETQQMDWLYFMIIVSVTYILIITPFSYDMTYKTSSMMNSLPISRREMVIYKYLSVFIYIFVSIVYVGVYLWIINKTGLKNVDYFNLSMIKRAIPYIMVSASIMLPANFKFEPNVARVVNIFLNVGTIVIALNIAQGSIEATPNKFITFLQSSNIILIAAVAYILSMILSVKLYQHRDL